MAFKFNLESVLKHRQRLEDFAQREFAEAQAAVDALLNEIEVMYARMDEVREEILAAQRGGSANQIGMVVQMENFLVGQKKQIEVKRLEARGLMVIAEEKQEKLIAAAREKKILVKLKERRQKEHFERLRQLEIKEQDDMTTIRLGWGKR